jgi:glycosyltransferase involved in cell wall biosynthesis
MTTCHGFISNSRKLRLYSLFDRYAIRACDTIVSVSEEIKHDLVARGLSAERIVVVPNAVDANEDTETLRKARSRGRAQHKIAKDTYVIGYLGRLSEEKGLVFLLDAFEQLADKDIRVTLMIVGDGADRTLLESDVKTRGLEEMVHFAGFQIDTHHWLAMFDCFVLPSLTEGTPMAMLEAMSMGVPVIATSVGGVPKVVRNGVNGLLVPSGSGTLIREKLELLISNPQMAKQLGTNGLITISEDYSLEKWGRTMEAKYVDLVA